MLINLQIVILIVELAFVIFLGIEYFFMLWRREKGCKIRWDLLIYWESKPIINNNISS
jgi:hypothetical protein